MAVLLCFLLILVLLTAEWYVHAALVTPLPRSVKCVFLMDEGNEGELEYALRGYRFLKRQGFLRGSFVIVPGRVSDQTRQAAELFARNHDISILDIEGVFDPE